ncbi:hypothetical protein [Streptomyces sp. NBC_01443]|uniref:hypothetical protein n=1 Tax=Streptomyces sp. NBC_01443 TaxID=2903868 RepID=UPI002250917E|nr:hypothetical protein [Streptomyces sp. NBC_01443]MCX4628659.1 hypothetical protein [Streptomyces sp. NBC_01443]
MPIDPYAALNAMLRAEVTRYTPPAAKPSSRGTDSEDAPAPAASVATSATGFESSPED